MLVYIHMIMKVSSSSVMSILACPCKTQQKIYFQLNANTEADGVKGT